MSTPKHTPGPWTVKDEDTVVGPQGNTIAECCGYSIRATDKDQIRQGGREANAALIAAAPAMYEALQQSLVLVELAALEEWGRAVRGEQQPPTTEARDRLEKVKAALAQAGVKP